MINNDPAVVDHSELSNIKAMFDEFGDDINAIRDTLMPYICKDNPMAFLDDVYMKKQLKEAMDFAKNENQSVIDAFTLFLCLVYNPSDTLKPFLSKMAIGVNDIPNLKLDDADNDAPMQKAADTLTSLFQGGEGVEPEANPKEPKVPAEKIAKQEIAKLIAETKHIRSELLKTVFGQDNAVNVFVSGYFQACLQSMIDKDKKRPRATFLFAGPPGVGKTFLALNAAKAIGAKLERFDMSEYCTQEAAIEFCGSDGVYKNSKSGNFTDVIKKNPKCVVLLDEIEKAHISIIHLFLQALDAGRIRDSKTDEEISLKNTILIFTTNAGKQLYKDSDEKDLSTLSRKVVIDALEKDINPETKEPYFPAAICSRFASGNVVMFNHIEVHHLRFLAKKEINRLADKFNDETGIKTEIDELVYTALLLSEGAKADARTITSRAQAFFNDELYELMRLISTEKVETTIADVETIKVDVDMSGMSDEIVGLFVPSEQHQVLMLASDETVSLCRSKISTCEIFGVQTCEAALETIRTKNINLIILDAKFGAGSNENLNVEDINTPAREFWQILRDQKDTTPICLIQQSENAIDEEEKVSFSRQGVRGFLEISKDGDDNFATKLEGILSVLHQQASMIKLATSNKLITFETSQIISEDGKIATIQLFDFKATVAVDAEDSKDVLSAVSRPNVRFEQVYGANDAKKELAYFVEYLKNPKKYMGTGVKAPKGVILYGPPGTGKTMLAKAMACESGVTFIATEGNSFLKKYIGEGSERVHELFKTARKYAPSILFIDEIDAIGKERGGEDSSSKDSGNTLTAFLTEMDGFINDPSKPVFVLAATNFDVEPGKPKSLDPALMRRFDRRVYIDLPSKEDRSRFLKDKIANNRALNISNAQVENISMRSTGMSLAELDSVVELALRSAIREGSTAVTDAIFDSAFETFNGGEVKKWDTSQLERVARHESGHALLCWLSGETPSYLTVVARGGHGGYMQHAEKEGKAIYTKDELLARIRTSLGGRAAEIVYYGDRDGISTGASGDLATATRIAKQLVCTYGMDDDFGLAVVLEMMDDNMSFEVRNAVNKILKEQMEEAINLVSQNKDKIDALVRELLNKNHLNEPEINEVLS